MFLSFLHCNFCGKSPASDEAFYASSCCHVVCNHCRITKRLDLLCPLCNREVTLNEICPDMVGKEFFADQVEVLQKFIGKIEAQMGDEEGANEISSNLYESNVFDNWADGTGDSSFDAEIEMNRVTKRVEKSVNLATKTIKNIDTLADQIESMINKSQEPRSLDLRWSTPIMRPFPYVVSKKQRRKLCW